MFEELMEMIKLSVKGRRMFAWGALLLRHLLFRLYFNYAHHTLTESSNGNRAITCQQLSFDWRR